MPFPPYLNTTPEICTWGMEFKLDSFYKSGLVESGCLSTTIEETGYHK